jgi:uncharacterized protein (DUF1499 family)
MSTPQLIKEIPMKKTIFLCMLLLSVSVSCSGKKTVIGLVNGNLQPCPGSPNCVVSQGGDAKHTIAPLSYKGDRERIFPLFRDLVITMDRVTLVQEDKNYLRFEFRTKVFGFVDDVEFLFPDEPVIHVRSASRTGYSDMGVNRKRIESIRQLMMGLPQE